MAKKIRKSIIISPEVWLLADELSKKDNRSISNYIENLIIKDKKK